MSERAEDRTAAAAIDDSDSDGNGDGDGDGVGFDIRNVNVAGRRMDVRPDTESAADTDENER